MRKLHPFRADRGLPQRPQGLPSHPGMPDGIPRILLLEDEERVRLCLAEALALRGYAVICGASLEDGQAALDKVGWRQVDLVLLDTHLSRDPQVRNGFVFHASWRARYPVPPFIFMDGWGDGKPPKESSCQVYAVAKPFSFQLLLSLIHAVLGR